MAVAVVLAAIPAALLICARIEAARFDEPQHRARECAVAAEIAYAMLDDLEAQAMGYGGGPLRIGVDPELRGLSRAGMEALLPRYMPATVLFFVPLPSSLDCTPAFERRHLPLLGDDHPPGARFMRLDFSRIVFSPDGNHAFLARGIRCGNLCGQGADMTWRRDGGRWVRESERGTWIS